MTKHCDKCEDGHNVPDGFGNHCIYCNRERFEDCDDCARMIGELKEGEKK